MFFEAGLNISLHGICGDCVRLGYLDGQIKVEKMQNEQNKGPWDSIPWMRKITLKHLSPEEILKGEKEISRNQESTGK